MSDEVLIARVGRMGVVTLNRPKTINALTREMIDTISEALVAWAGDAGIRAVLFESSSPRGFCAGGDVRRVRDQLLAGDLASVDQFFVHEYRLNRMIAVYDKPIIALMGGVVMGGGIGLGGHAALRIAADTAKFAMPETAIGLFCDVGVNALLAKVPEHRALAFSLFGLPVGPGDARALNLCDHIVPETAFPQVRERLIAAVSETAVENVSAIAAQFAAETEATTPFMEVADALEGCFTAEDAGAMVARIYETTALKPGLAPYAEALRARCPTSLEAIVQLHRAARRDADIAAVLANDLRMAGYMIRRADFAEGVRAVLVDKDNKPVWAPAELADVDSLAIAGLVL